MDSNPNQGSRQSSRKIRVPKAVRARWANHAPGHVREMFLEAIDAFANWNEGEPEPTVTYEINYERREVTISQACGLLWNCKDVLPSPQYYDWLRDCAVEPGRQTLRRRGPGNAESIKRTPNRKPVLQ